METKGSTVAGRVAADAQSRLPPGFRFRPTDEELVVHYLRRRALSSPLPAAVDIPEVRILAHDPADLLPPGWAEEERYFFTCKEAKYVKGRRANRATDAGYWKATGKEKQVAVSVPAPKGRGGDRQAVVVGMKRSLVFYRGKAPSGEKTHWVMHEYRLAGAGLAPCRRAQGSDADAAAAQPSEGWVLCRVFRKKKGAAADRSDTTESPQDPVDEDESSGVPFIDFFARADALGRPRAASPLSSSCVTEASGEHCREQQESTRSS